VNSTNQILPQFIAIRKNIIYFFVLVNDINRSVTENKNQEV